MPEPRIVPVADDGFEPAGAAGAETSDFQLFNGWTTTVTNGSGLQIGNSITLVWSIVPDGSTINASGPSRPNENTDGSILIQTFDTIYGAGPGGADLTQRPWFPLMVSAVSRFGEFSGITYVYRPLSTQISIPDSGNLANPDILIGGHFIGLNAAGGDVLAYNAIPNGGDMVIDTDNATDFADPTNNFRFLRDTLMHEFGHGVGLAHVISTGSEFLMEPFINTTFDGPQLDEVLGLQRLYGDALDKGNGNDTFGNATDLGVIPDRSSVTIGTLGDNTVVQLSQKDFVSIDDESDIDFFKFTTSAAASVTLNLVPRGTTYSQGPQGGTESPFDSRNQSDLQFDLLATNGTTVLQSANDNGIGGNESIAGFDLSVAGTYFVRVRGTTADKIQLYGLSVSVTEKGTTTPTVPAGPSITSLYPVNGGTNAPIATPLVITFSDNITIGTGSIQIKKYSDDSVVQTINVTSRAVSVSGSVVTIVPPTVLADSTTFYVVIPDTAFKDSNGVAFGGITVNSAWNFTTVDLTNPKIVDFNPADDLNGASVSANLVATFNEPVTKSSGFITIYNGDGTVFETFPVTSSPLIGLTDNVLTINPTKNLDYGKPYYVQISSGSFRDASGNLFAGITDKTTWNFVTVPPDKTPPAVTVFTPSDNSTNASVSENLSITFNETILKASGTITIFRANDTIFESFDIATSQAVTLTSNNVVTINPSFNLASSTNYYVQITPGGFKDAADNLYAGIADKTTWNFSTEDVSAPFVIKYNPADDSVNVALDANLEITFDEAVNKRPGIITLFTADDRVVENFNVSTSSRVTVAGSLVTIDPASNLIPGKGYYVRIWEGAFDDIAKNQFVGTVDSKTWNFNAVPPDTTAPTVASLTPADGDPAAPSGGNLVITFSEKVVKGTGSVFLYGVDGVLVESFDVAKSNQVTVQDMVVTVDPTKDLIDNKGYYVLISNGAFLDTSKNKFAGLADKSAWDFVVPDSHPVITSASSASIAENSPATDVVLDVNASLAAFPTHELVYQLSGDDAAKLQIESDTGKIRFLASPDFEAPGDKARKNTYRAKVTVADKTATSNNVTQDITINVTPVNDNDPYFVVQSPTFKVPENSPVGTAVGQPGAKDADQPNDSLTYSIIGGNSSGAFKIEPQSGIISVADPSKLDFETSPTFSLQVRVVDAANPQHSATSSVTIQLENVAEGARLSFVGVPVTSEKGKTVTVFPNISVIGASSLPDGGTLKLVADIVTTIKNGAIVAVDKYTIPSISKIGTGGAARIENGKLVVEVQLNRGVSVSAIQSFLRGIKFGTTGTGLDVTTRAVSVGLQSGTEAPSYASQTINVTK